MIVSINFNKVSINFNEINKIPLQYLIKKTQDCKCSFAYDRYLSDIRDMICGQCAVHEFRTRILIMVAKRAREAENTEEDTKETERVDSV